MVFLVEVLLVARAALVTVLARQEWIPARFVARVEPRRLPAEHPSVGCPLLHPVLAAQWVAMALPVDPAAAGILLLLPGSVVPRCCVASAPGSAPGIGTISLPAWT